MHARGIAPFLKMHPRGTITRLKMQSTGTFIVYDLSFLEVVLYEVLLDSCNQLLYISKNYHNGRIGQTGMILYNFEVIFIFEVVFIFEVAFLFERLSSFLRLS